MLVLAIALVLWTSGYSLELARSGLDRKLFWSKVQYLGIAAVPAAWLWLSLTYTRILRRLSRKQLVSLWAIPVLTVVAAWTNELHGLLWTRVSLSEQGSLPIAIFDYGPWFGIHLMVSYALVATASVILLRTTLMLPDYGKQTLGLATGAALPLLANLAQITETSPVYPYDLTPTGFALGGVVLGIGLTRFHILDLIPVGRTIVVDRLHDGVLVLDTDGHIIDVNPAATRMLDKDSQALLGEPVTEVMPEAEPLLEASENDGEATAELTLPRADGARTYAVHARPIAEPGATPCGSLIDIHDITDLRSAEARAEFLAYRDALTGLPNRELFRDRFEQALALGRRQDSHVACVFLDLDDFKKVNDHYGHSVGDQLLKEAAQRITKALRSADTVARLPDGTDSSPTLARFGGDEFVILLHGVKRPADAGVAAERVVERLRRPFQLGRSMVSVRVSAGIAVAPQDGDSVEVLLRNADAAMYGAKRRGGDRIQFFTRAINEHLRSRMEIENELHHALVSRQLALEYQPQFEISTGELKAVEALIRWDHPTRGRIHPGEFLPVAEETGLILPIGEWVMEQACEDWAEIRSTCPSCRLAVNLSARQVAQSGIEDVIEEALQNNGLGGEDLEVEFTEQALMQDVDLAETALERFRELGVTMAVDDFGLGTASLAYMRSFALDVIKIDGSFIHDIDDPHNAKLVRAIIAMARELGLYTVGEGVEAHDQLDFLRAEGCDRVQGYLLGKPLPNPEIRQFLRTHEGWPAAIRASA